MSNLIGLGKHYSRRRFYVQLQENDNENSLWWHPAWLLTLQLQESSGCFACDNSLSGFTYQKTLLASSQAMLSVYFHFSWCLVHIMMQMHTSKISWSWAL